MRNDRTAGRMDKLQRVSDAVRRRGTKRKTGVGEVQMDGLPDDADASVYQGPSEAGNTDGVASLPVGEGGYPDAGRRMGSDRGREQRAERDAEGVH